MDIRSIFVDGNGWVRSGWRCAVFSIVFVIFAVMIGFLGIALVNLLFPPPALGNLNLFTSGILTLIAALLAGWLCGKYLEGLPFRALGASFTKRWLRHLLSGIVIGAATLALAVLIAFLFGGLSFAPNVVDNGLLPKSLALAFVVFAVGAAAEEALFRGYIFQTFVRSHLAWLAIALTSIFFGAIHLRNPDAGVISTLNTILAGVWFGIAYLKTRDLWFVWGMHLMWNWMQGAFFGIEVSGLTDLVSSPLLKEIDTGPKWLTGETYGIEGGIVTTIALIVSTAVIYFTPFLRPSEEIVQLQDPARHDAQARA